METANMGLGSAEKGPAGPFFGPPKAWESTWVSERVPEGFPKGGEGIPTGMDGI